jgi:hypothetical protein
MGKASLCTPCAGAAETVRALCRYRGVVGQLIRFMERVAVTQHTSADRVVFRHHQNPIYRRLEKRIWPQNEWGKAVANSVAFSRPDRASALLNG